MATTFLISRRYQYISPGVHKYQSPGCRGYYVFNFTTVSIYKGRSAQMPAARPSWRLSFIHWRLIFVDPQYVGCSVASFWRVALQGCFSANIFLTFFLITLKNDFDPQSYISFSMAQQPPSLPQWARASLFMRFLEPTQLYTHTLGRTPLDEWSARRTDRYLHNTQQTLIVR